MLDLTRCPKTDPTSLYRGRDGLYAEDMLIAALTGLDFFSWLDAHPGSVEDIARHFGFHTRPVDVMTTLFVAMELLERDGATLRLTETAREHLAASGAEFGCASSLSAPKFRAALPELLKGEDEDFRCHIARIANGERAPGDAP